VTTFLPALPLPLCSWIHASQATAGRTRSGPRPSESAGLTELFSSSVSQWKPVTTVRADCEFAIAFRVPPPPVPVSVPVPPPSPPPRRLKRRCGGRHFFHGRRVDRSGTRTRSTSNRKPSRQAEKEECVAHECSPREFPCRQRQRFRCCSEAHVYVSSMAGRTRSGPRPSRPLRLNRLELS
jgi:hypothetical protein